MEKTKLTPRAFKDYITQHMTADEALLKLLESSLLQYEKLKFDDKSKSVHPLFIITMAAMDMGWSIAIEGPNGDPNQQVSGITVGTEEYMNKIFKKNETDSNKSDS